MTIRKGELGGWGNAVRLQGTSRNRIRDVVAAGAGAAIVIEGGDANEIRASTIFGRSGGIAASGSARLTVAGNRASGAFSPGIRVDGELANIVRNQVPREGDVFPLAAGVEVTGSGHRIADNRVTGSWGGSGILVRAGSDNVLSENEVSASMPRPA